MRIYPAQVPLQQRPRNPQPRNPQPRNPQPVPWTREDHVKFYCKVLAIAVVATAPFLYALFCWSLGRPNLFVICKWAWYLQLFFGIVFVVVSFIYKHLMLGTPVVVSLPLLLIWVLGCQNSIAIVHPFLQYSVGIVLALVCVVVLFTHCPKFVAPGNLGNTFPPEYSGVALHFSCALLWAVSTFLWLIVSADEFWKGQPQVVGGFDLSHIGPG